jgi:hypothetical protein
MPDKGEQTALEVVRLGGVVLPETRQIHRDALAYAAAPLRRGAREQGVHFCLNATLSSAIERLGFVRIFSSKHA